MIKFMPLASACWQAPKQPASPRAKRANGGGRVSPTRRAARLCDGHRAGGWESAGHHRAGLGPDRPLPAHRARSAASRFVFTIKKIRIFSNPNSIVSNSKAIFYTQNFFSNPN